MDPSQTIGQFAQMALVILGIVAALGIVALVQRRNVESERRRDDA